MSEKRNYCVTNVGANGVYEDFTIPYGMFYDATKIYGNDTVITIYGGKNLDDEGNIAVHGGENSTWGILFKKSSVGRGTLRLGTQCIYLNTNWLDSVIFSGTDITIAIASEESLTITSDIGMTGGLPDGTGATENDDKKGIVVVQNILDSSKVTPVSFSGTYSTAAGIKAENLYVTGGVTGNISVTQGIIAYYDDYEGSEPSPKSATTYSYKIFEASGIYASGSSILTASENAGVSASDAPAVLYIAGGFTSDAASGNQITVSSVDRPCEQTTYTSEDSKYGKSTSLDLHSSRRSLYLREDQYLASGFRGQSITIGGDVTGTVHTTLTRTIGAVVLPNWEYWNYYTEKQNTDGTSATSTIMLACYDGNSTTLLVPHDLAGTDYGNAAVESNTFRNAGYDASASSSSKLTFSGVFSGTVFADGTAKAVAKSMLENVGGTHSDETVTSIDNVLYEGSFEGGSFYAYTVMTAETNSNQLLTYGMVAGDALVFSKGFRDGVVSVKSGAVTRQEGGAAPVRDRASAIAWAGVTEDGRPVWTDDGNTAGRTENKGKHPTEAATNTSSVLGLVATARVTDNRFRTEGLSGNIENEETFNGGTISASSYMSLDARASGYRYYTDQNGNILYYADSSEAAIRNNSAVTAAVTGETLRFLDFDTVLTADSDLQIILAHDMPGVQPEWSSKQTVHTYFDENYFTTAALLASTDGKLHTSGDLDGSLKVVNFGSKVRVNSVADVRLRRQMITTKLNGASAGDSSGNYFNTYGIGGGAVTFSNLLATTDIQVNAAYTFSITDEAASFGVKIGKNHVKVSAIYAENTLEISETLKGRYVVNQTTRNYTEDTCTTEYVVTGLFGHKIVIGSTADQESSMEGDPDTVIQVATGITDTSGGTEIDNRIVAGIYSETTLNAGEDADGNVKNFLIGDKTFIVAVNTPGQASINSGSYHYFFSAAVYAGQGMNLEVDGALYAGEGNVATITIGTGANAFVYHRDTDKDGLNTAGDYQFAWTYGDSTVYTASSRPGYGSSVDYQGTPYNGSDVAADSVDLGTMVIGGTSYSRYTNDDKRSTAESGYAYRYAWASENSQVIYTRSNSTAETQEDYCTYAEAETAVEYIIVKGNKYKFTEALAADQYAWLYEYTVKEKTYKVTVYTEVRNPVAGTHNCYSDISMQISSRIAIQSASWKLTVAAQTEQAVESITVDDVKYSYGGTEGENHFWTQSSSGSKVYTKVRNPVDGTDSCYTNAECTEGAKSISTVTWPDDQDKTYDYLTEAHADSITVEGETYLYVENSYETRGYGVWEEEKTGTKVYTNGRDPVAGTDLCYTDTGCTEGGKAIEKVTCSFIDPVDSITVQFEEEGKTVVKTYNYWYGSESFGYYVWKVNGTSDYVYTKVRNPVAGTDLCYTGSTFETEKGTISEISGESHTFNDSTHRFVWKYDNQYVYTQTQYPPESTECRLTETETTAATGYTRPTFSINGITYTRYADDDGKCADSDFRYAWKNQSNDVIFTESEEPPEGSYCRYASGETVIRLVSEASDQTITINGKVYTRDAAKDGGCRDPEHYYAWSNGSTVFYTDNDPKPQDDAYSRIGAPVTIQTVSGDVSDVTDTLKSYSRDSNRYKIEGGTCANNRELLLAHSQESSLSDAKGPSSYAISAQSTEVTTNTNATDTIVIDSDAVIFGSIELGGGKNFLTIDSSAQLFGSLYSTNGASATVQFNLRTNDNNGGEASELGIITSTYCTDGYNVLENKAVNYSINLQDDISAGSYILIEGNLHGNSNVSDGIVGWVGRELGVLYGEGKTLTLTVNGGYETYFCNGEKRYISATYVCTDNLVEAGTDAEKICITVCNSLVEFKNDPSAVSGPVSFNGSTHVLQWYGQREYDEHESKYVQAAAYTVQYKKSSEGASEWHTVMVENGSTSYNFTGMLDAGTDGTDYDFRVSAIFKSGSVSEWGVASKTTAMPEAPAASLTPDAVKNTGNSMGEGIALDWTDASSPYGIEKYTVTVDAGNDDLQIVRTVTACEQVQTGKILSDNSPTEVGSGTISEDGNAVCTMVLTGKDHDGTVTLQGNISWEDISAGWTTIYSNGVRYQGVTVHDYTTYRVVEWTTDTKIDVYDSVGGTSSGIAERSMTVSNTVLDTTLSVTGKEFDVKPSVCSEQYLFIVSDSMTGTTRNPDAGTEVETLSGDVSFAGTFFRDDLKAAVSGKTGNSDYGTMLINGKIISGGTLYSGVDVSNSIDSACVNMTLKGVQVILGATVVSSDGTVETEQDLIIRNTGTDSANLKYSLSMEINPETCGFESSSNGEFAVIATDGFLFAQSYTSADSITTQGSKIDFSAFFSAEQVQQACTQETAKISSMTVGGMEITPGDGTKVYTVSDLKTGASEGGALKLLSIRIATGCTVKLNGTTYRNATVVLGTSGSRVQILGGASSGETGTLQTAIINAEHLDYSYVLNSGSTQTICMKQDGTAFTGTVSYEDLSNVTGGIRQWNTRTFTLGDGTTVSGGFLVYGGTVRADSTITDADTEYRNADLSITDALVILGGTTNSGETVNVLLGSDAGTDVTASFDLTAEKISDAAKTEWLEPSASSTPATYENRVGFILKDSCTMPLISLDHEVSVKFSADDLQYDKAAGTTVHGIFLSNGGTVTGGTLFEDAVIANDGVKITGVTVVVGAAVKDAKGVETKNVTYVFCDAGSAATIYATEDASMTSAASESTFVKAVGTAGTEIFTLTAGENHALVTEISISGADITKALDGKEGKTEYAPLILNGQVFSGGTLYSDVSITSGNTVLSGVDVVLNGGSYTVIGNNEKVTVSAGTALTNLSVADCTVFVMNDDAGTVLTSEIVRSGSTMTYSATVWAKNFTGGTASDFSGSIGGVTITGGTMYVGASLTNKDVTVSNVTVYQNAEKTITVCAYDAESTFSAGTSSLEGGNFLFTMQTNSVYDGNCSIVQSGSVSLQTWFDGTPDLKDITGTQVTDPITIGTDVITGGTLYTGVQFSNYVMSLNGANVVAGGKLNGEDKNYIVYGVVGEAASVAIESGTIKDQSLTGGETLINFDSNGNAQIQVSKTIGGQQIGLSGTVNIEGAIGNESAITRPVTIRVFEGGTITEKTVTNGTRVTGASIGNGTLKLSGVTIYKSCTITDEDGTAQDGQSFLVVDDLESRVSVLTSTSGRITGVGKIEDEDTKIAVTAAGVAENGETFSLTRMIDRTLMPSQICTASGNVVTSDGSYENVTITCGDVVISGVTVDVTWSKKTETATINSISFDKKESQMSVKGNDLGQVSAGAEYTYLIREGQGAEIGFSWTVNGKTLTGTHTFTLDDLEEEEGFSVAGGTTYLSSGFNALANGWTVMGGTLYSDCTIVSGGAMLSGVSVVKNGMILDENNIVLAEGGALILGSGTMTAIQDVGSNLAASDSEDFALQLTTNGTVIRFTSGGTVYAGTVTNVDVRGGASAANGQTYVFNGRTFSGGTLVTGATVTTSRVRANDATGNLENTTMTLTGVTVLRDCVVSGESSKQTILLGNEALTTISVVTDNAYTWDVEAVDFGGGTLTEEGTAGSFLVGEEVRQVANPENLKFVFDKGTTTLSWTCDTVTTQYVLQYSTSSDFSRDVITETVTSSTVTLSQLTELEHYYWRVKGVKNNWQSDWVNGDDFKVYTYDVSEPLYDKNVLWTTTYGTDTKANQFSLSMNWGRVSSDLGGGTDDQYVSGLKNYVIRYSLNGKNESTILPIFNSIRVNGGTAEYVYEGVKDNLYKWVGGGTVFYTKTAVPAEGETVYNPSDLSSAGTVSFVRETNPTEYYFEFLRPGTYTSISLGASDWAGNTLQAIFIGKNVYFRNASKDQNNRYAWSYRNGASTTTRYTLSPTPIDGDKTYDTATGAAPDSSTVASVFGNIVIADAVSDCTAVTIVPESSVNDEENLRNQTYKVTWSGAKDNWSSISGNTFDFQYVLEYSMKDPSGNFFNSAYTSTVTVKATENGLYEYVFTGADEGGLQADGTHALQFGKEYRFRVYGVGSDSADESYSYVGETVACSKTVVAADPYPFDTVTITSIRQNSSEGITITLAKPAKTQGSDKTALKWYAVSFCDGTGQVVYSRNYTSETIRITQQDAQKIFEALEDYTVSVVPVTEYNIAGESSSKSFVRISTDPPKGDVDVSVTAYAGTITTNNGEYIRASTEDVVEGGVIEAYAWIGIESGTIYTSDKLPKEGDGYYNTPSTTGGTTGTIQSVNTAPADVLDASWNEFVDVYSIDQYVFTWNGGSQSGSETFSGGRNSYTVSVPLTQENTKYTWVLTVTDKEGNQTTKTGSVTSGYWNREWDVQAAPTGLSHTIAAAVTVSWTAPETDGNAKIDHYELRYRKVKSDEWITVTTESASTSYKFVDLDAKTEYEWSVRAFNTYPDNNCSVWSEEDTFTTSDTTPLTITAVNVVNWDVVCVTDAVGGTAGTGEIVEGAKIPGGTIESGTVTGAEDVQAVINGAVTGGTTVTSVSGGVVGITLIGGTVVGSSSAIVAEERKYRDTVTISWDAYKQSGSVTYKLTLYTLKNGKPTKFGSKTVSSDEMLSVDFSLKEDTEYRWTLEAKNEDGDWEDDKCQSGTFYSGYWTQQTGPSKLICTVNRNRNEVALSWKAAASTGGTESPYYVVQVYDVNSGTVAYEKTTEATHLTIDNLAESTQYCWTVSAVNGLTDTEIPVRGGTVLYVTDGIERSAEVSGEKVRYVTDDAEKIDEVSGGTFTTYDISAPVPTTDPVITVVDAHTKFTNFEWGKFDDVSGVQYTFQISASDDFSVLADSCYRQSDTGFTTEKLTSGTYYYRLQAVDASENANASEWYSGSFTTPAAPSTSAAPKAVQNANANAEGSISYTISWDRMDPAEYVQVQLYEAASKTTVYSVILDAKDAEGQYVLSTNVDLKAYTGKTLAVRVRGLLSQETSEQIADQYVDAGDWSASTTITVQDNPGNSFDNARLMEVGEVYQHTVSAGTMDYYKYVLPYSGEYTITVSNSTDTVMTVYDGSRTAIRYTSGQAQSLAAGEYYVTVYGKNPAGYSITCTSSIYAPEPGNSVETAPLVEYGRSLTGITNSKEESGTDYFRYSVRSGSYMLQTLAGSVETKLYDTNGNVVGTNEKGDYVLDDGEYIVGVSSGTVSQQYTFFFKTSARTDAASSVREAASASPLLNGDVLIGAVGAGAAEDFYRITGDQAHSGNWTFTLTADPDNASGYAAKNLTVQVGTLKNGSFKKLATAVYNRNLSNGQGGYTLTTQILAGADVSYEDLYLRIASADNGKTKNSTYQVSVSNQVYTLSDISNNSALCAEKLVLTGGTLADGTLMGGTSGTKVGWVGYGDAADYYTFKADECPGNFTFTISQPGNTGFEYNASNLKVQVGIMVNGQFKSLATAKRNKKTGLYAVSYQFAEGTDIYVCVTSADNGKGKKNSVYQLDIRKEAFARADNTNDDPLAPGVVTLAAGTAASSWVGYGDAVDFYCIDMTKAQFAGKGAVVLSNPSLTDCSYNASNLKMQIGILKDGKFKAVATAKRNKTTGTFYVDAQLDRNTEYYVKVYSADNGKKKNSSYQLTYVLDEYSLSHYDNQTPLEADHNGYSLAYNTDSEKAWVGFGDAVDCYALDFGDKVSGIFTFAVKNAENVKNLKLQIGTKTASGEFQALASGKVKNGVLAIRDCQLKNDTQYYVQVTSADKGKGKKNSAYQLQWSGSWYNTNNADDTIELARSQEGQTSGELLTDWVGLGDAIDCRKLILNSGDTALSLNIGNTKANLTLSLCNASGSVVASLTSKEIRNGTRLDVSGLSGTYYAKIQTTDENKYMTNYTLAVI